MSHSTFADLRVAEPQAAEHRRERALAARAAVHDGLERLEPRVLGEEGHRAGGAGDVAELVFVSEPHLLELLNSIDASAGVEAAAEAGEPAEAEAEAEVEPVAAPAEAQEAAVAAAAAAVVSWPRWSWGSLPAG